MDLHPALGEERSTIICRIPKSSITWDRVTVILAMLSYRPQNGLLELTMTVLGEPQGTYPAKNICAKFFVNRHALGH